MIVRFVLVRTALSEGERQHLRQLFYSKGWPKDKTTFVFDPTDPQSGDMHLENLRRCQDAGETVIAILEPEPLPAKAIRAGFPHIILSRVTQLTPSKRPMQVVAVRTQLEIFVPNPPPTA